MIGGVLQSLLGGKTSQSEIPPEPEATSHSFDSIDQYKAGLAERLRRYLSTGQEPEVLGDVANAVAQKPANRLFYKIVNEVRAEAHGCGGDNERLARLIHFQKALGVPEPKKNERDVHRARVPSDTGRLLNLFLDRRMPQGLATPTMSADVVEAAKLLGGSEVDFVAYLLPTLRGANSLVLQDITGDADESFPYKDRIPTDVLIAALERCDTKTRTLALQIFRAHAAENTPEFLEYLFSQFDETSENLRNALLTRVLNYAPEKVEAQAIPRLRNGKASLRADMAKVLGSLGTPTAMEALQEQREQETARSVLTILEQFLDEPGSDFALVDHGYLDVNGCEVTTATRPVLVDDGTSSLGEDFLTELLDLEDTLREGAQLRQLGDADGIAETDHLGLEIDEFADAVFSCLNTPVEVEGVGLRLPSQFRDLIEPTIERALDRLPLKRVVDLACANSETLIDLLHAGSTAFSRAVQYQLWEGNLNFLQVIEIAEKSGLPASWAWGWNGEESYTAHYVSALIGTNTDQTDHHFEIYPDFWELAAPHLGLIVEALPPRSLDLDTNRRALDMAASFPSLPEGLKQPLLAAAMDERPEIRLKAQELLFGVPGLNEALIELLDDKRQTVRANAARFLVEQGVTAALPQLYARLKKEKSEYARAELISAVSALDGQTASYLGKPALIEEAEALIAKLPKDKIDWLDLSEAPALLWADGSPALPILADAWLRLATKLNAPLGSPLFRLYFEQIAPQSRTAFADWVLERWIAYDTEALAEDELREKASEMAEESLSTPANWMVHVGYTRSQIIAAHMQNLSVSYMNSGLDCKGVLALTHHASAENACAAISDYLKYHGRRVAQAKALVETLFGMGSKEAIQLLVTTATRSKYRGVREHAESLVKELAEARGWSEETLADRSVPTGGFADDGSLALPIGEDSKPYLARLAPDLTVKLFNPVGRQVKSLPAGKDETTKSSKSLLSHTKKTLNSVRAHETARLYEAMLTSRVWSFEDWVNDLTTHPILKHLIERVIWRGLDEEGGFVTGLRLTADGQVLNEDGNDVDLSCIVKLDLAHSSNMPAGSAAAWQQHQEQHSMAALFPQVSRPWRRLNQDQRHLLRIPDFEGWFSTTHALRDIAAAIGYERGPLADDASFSIYRKVFQSAGLCADVKFTGSFVGDQDLDTTIEFMQFTSIESSRPARALPLGNVPPLVLSEAWNDLQEFAHARKETAL